MLAHPSPTAKLNLTIDASDSSIGAVLQKNTATGFYSACKRELLAIFQAVKHFKYQIEAHHFSIPPKPRASLAPTDKATGFHKPALNEFKTHAGFEQQYSNSHCQKTPMDII